MHLKKDTDMNGLYVPQAEHDSCGIGFIADLKGRKTQKTIQDALIMLENMEHRGGCGCEPETGDGAGILIETPHEFFKSECEHLGYDLPDFGEYGVGVLFIPKNRKVKEECKAILNQAMEELGFELIGYRKVPVNPRGLGDTALKTEPDIEHVLVKHKDGLKKADLERKLYVLRNFATHTIGHQVEGNHGEFYITSFSHRVIVYKGQLRTDQVKSYYPDLSDARVLSRIALIHSRFSTNTFPKWKLAQPFRFIAHNGEINTIRGNVNKMKSKEALMQSELFSDEELQKLLPVCDASHSDSANLDSLVELLALAGRSLPHVMMMLIPEAWQDNALMDEKRKFFYKYHASLMEPWDGPASICFTDGEYVGATLDRNGLRPSRYCVTKDGRVIMASEAGALPVDQANVLYKGRLQPGKMFIVNLDEGRVVTDEEIKEEICSAKPYDKWVKEQRVKLRMLPDAKELPNLLDEKSLRTRQQAFGYTAEDLRVILGPMAEAGKEPTGSMGADTPLAVLSEQSQHISHYFKQLFAQVSNPAIDPIRERMVMSLFTRVGNSLNILGETPEHCKQIHISQPVLSQQDFYKLTHAEELGYKTYVLDATFSSSGENGALKSALRKISEEAEKAVAEGYNILVVSDRNISKDRSPIPSLMATGAVHHHLIEQRVRTKAGIIVEAGDAREVHHFATLVGYGASAVYPYLAYETIIDLNQKGKLEKELSEEEVIENFITAIGNGLLKVMSKMGISTLQSYQSSQIFEALGISREVIDFCFKGTVSRISGMNFDDFAKETLVRHRLAFPVKEKYDPRLEVGGIYQWKRRGEYHLFNPETIHLLQHSTRTQNYELYKKYAQLINDQTRKAATLRGLLDFNKKRNPIPLNEVEPKEAIFRRFATGAMSFGSISHEAHSTLAIAMNRIGGKSNSGEGGEDEIRFDRKPNGDWERSAIKQVASGRFGVTSYYLTNANELQIKISQGAKPGEGGQLPGHKVDDWIGRVRHSTPGVGLISPPPHHDIYSIEDLAQLIFDLKNANRKARINVKLVSEMGVGTVAAGVAKAMADVVLISGADGGTGASPISSIRHAGLPWELGLAEAHQTLVKNNLRSRITVQTDGQIKTGRDLAFAILLGAEEFGVSTAALVVEGCIMMRKCHLNTCPVGVATQDPELRKLFTGKPEHVVNLFSFLAEELREIMSELGFRTIDEMVGQTDFLKVRENIDHWKFSKLDLSPVIHKEAAGPNVGIFKTREQDHKIFDILDKVMIKKAQPALEYGERIEESFNIVNTDRAVGAMLSNEISKKYKGEGLPEGTIHYRFKGSAGQSFGAFAAPGLRFELEGEANDYFGKGLSGGQLIIYPDKQATFRARENIIIGNVAFYGATRGEAYIRGMAGERFLVRNSGVKAVIEGVGDHACEYMTGGTAVILGPTGKNFAAGMSGGIAYVFDPFNQLGPHCNMELVAFEPLEVSDIEEIKRLVENHQRLTGSDLAAVLMDNWSSTLSAFVKVMPQEYKKALEKLEKKEMKEAI